MHAPRALKTTRYWSLLSLFTLLAKPEPYIRIASYIRLWAKPVALSTELTQVEVTRRNFYSLGRIAANAVVNRNNISIKDNVAYSIYE